MGAAALVTAGLGIGTTYALLPLFFGFVNIIAGAAYYQKQHSNQN